MSDPSSLAPGAMRRYQSEAGAKSYARKYERSWARRRTARREQAILTRMIGRFDPGASLLNVACGTGRFASAMAPGLRSRTTFADASQAMLDQAREACLAAGVPGISFRLADVTRDVPADRSDLVVCIRLLHHLDGDSFDRAVGFLTASAAQAIVVTWASSSTWKGFWRRIRRRILPSRGGEVLRSRFAVEAAFAARGWRVADAAGVSALFSTQAWLLLVPVGAR